MVESESKSKSSEFEKIKNLKTSIDKQKSEYQSDYFSLLESSAKKRKSIVCFGLDPVLEKIPNSVKGSTKQRIVRFYSEIIDASLNSKDAQVSALKPNYAFYAQYGFEGLLALKEILDLYRGKIPLILDVKRGDIGSTSSAYAKECFDFWGADSATVSPFMGFDSIDPYFSHLQNGKGIYLLCRTSNKGAGDFISSKMQDGRALYSHVLDKAASWHKDGMGLVVGATDIADLNSILEQINSLQKRFALLIPGVGSQGGSAQDVANSLRKYPNLLKIARINSSSGISYAYQKTNSDDFVSSAIEEIRKLNQSIGKI